MLITDAATDRVKPRNNFGVVCSSSAIPFIMSSIKAMDDTVIFVDISFSGIASLLGFVQTSTQKYGTEPMLKAYSAEHFRCLL